MWMTWDDLIWGSALLALYWLTDKVGRPRVQVGYNWENQSKESYSIIP
jgi:hypothetical protein